VGIESQPVGLGVSGPLVGKAHHYSSHRSARSTLVHRIDHEIIPGVRVERRGRLILLYPIPVTSAEVRRALDAT
jgi:hypothetical protein